jgi:predicted O-methyltransferase YrrM
MTRIALGVQPSTARCTVPERHFYAHTRCAPVPRRASRFEGVVIATAARPPSLGYAEAYATEDPVLQTARNLAAELGLTAVSPGAGSVLRLLAAAGSAKAVVEIGTGAGVSGLWLLRGMRTDGVLTTIDVDHEHQRIARRVFQEAGYPANRTRIITGRALDVLPRLADNVYDLVFVDADATETTECTTAAHRLLRPGGTLILNNALANGRIGDPAARDVDTVTIRDCLKTVRESDLWIPTLIPTGAGLLAAVKVLP